MIYFIGAAGGVSPIKVGFSRDPERRLAGLQTATYQELHLLGVMFGTMDDEAEFHRRFADGHVRGEWYRRDTPGLLEAISGALDIWDVEWCDLCGEPFSDDRYRDDDDPRVCARCELEFRRARRANIRAQQAAWDADPRSDQEKIRAAMLQAEESRSYRPE